LRLDGASFVDLSVDADDRRVGEDNPQPVLPDLQFVRMRNGVRKPKAELAMQ